MKYLKNIILLNNKICSDEISQNILLLNNKICSDEMSQKQGCYSSMW
jgi:uncharacterized membrane protein